MSHHDLISAIFRFWRRAMRTTLARWLMANYKLAFTQRQQDPANLARRQAWDQKRDVLTSGHVLDWLRLSQGRLRSGEIEPAIAS